MKSAFMISAFAFWGFASHAETNIEFTDNCLAQVIEELDDTNPYEEDSCVGSAFVNSIEEVNGKVYSINFGRESCELSLWGTADVTLDVLKQEKTKTGQAISECKVLKLEVTDEGAD